MNIAALMLCLLGVFPAIEFAWGNALMVAFINHVLIKIGHYK